MTLLRRFKAPISRAVEKMGWVMVRRTTLMKPFTRQYSKLNLVWGFPSGRGIGGWVSAPNASRGYHGILLQWFEHYHARGDVLLIAESRQMAAEFESRYPNWRWVAVDLYTDINDGQPDHVVDICKVIPPSLVGKYGSVFCQATLEHVYDPMSAIRNLSACLSAGGLLLLHTHTPPFMYHPCPRDYLRFNIDWFEDIENHVPELSLSELIAKDGHICCAYTRK